MVPLTKQRIADDLVKSNHSIAKLKDPRSKVALIPAYSKAGTFGYFICNETHTHDGNPHMDYFLYDNEYAFVLGTEPNGYETAVELFNQVCSEQE